ncbi:unannotated protein [freshwater metagenome]|uniref:Unannotated protein n=1 Tax=freshwater metagenome TaxID=449393 RepID=A0A6J7CL67_9ZZZZ|nr:CinA family protein [Actinomycetota bacterium]MSV63966.1 nicotinamide-nucleotide amidohydrolase family protein [Actinomycetota bacterium]MSW25852.1 nicotinamide-nucleotide amidohydrolase family protein [Actinomycetota bacterium]MSW34144.1 nicotinamide-nucleotide amidohydrolase family protein [Actinomycetota bacterium]MSX30706.1 nicotinamide-nucleotide amidohydrolase family protein [Actinomycetota bacterium]
MNTLAEQIVNALRERGQSLSVGESLTGGGLGAHITSVPRSSDVFRGGVIAYSADAKSRLLGVDATLIKEHGVVSEEVAIAMAHGAMAVFGSTWALATTGVAGPGASDGVEAGSVWVAICGPVEQSIQLALDGEREVVRNATISSVLSAFSRILSTQ